MGVTGSARREVDALGAGPTASGIGGRPPADISRLYLQLLDIAITVAVDDTLFVATARRCAGWAGSTMAPRPRGIKLGFGHNGIVAGIIVMLSLVSHPVALPVLATGAKGSERSKPDLARDLVEVLTERFPDRRIDLRANAAYGCGSFAGLGQDRTITTRA